jgi:hypothetical protein
MATVTPNYSWPVPTSTDLVKDGATAIEALGDAIDATVFGLGGSGLTLVKSQAVGTTVSSVTLTGAFSATYDNYRVIYADGTGSNLGYITVQLRTGAATAITNYYSSIIGAAFSGAAVGAAGFSNTSGWGYAASTDPGDFQLLDLEIRLPFLTKKTLFFGNSMLINQPMITGGFHDSATSYDQLVITPPSGTFTGGTIYVYGYGK